MDTRYQKINNKKQHDSFHHTSVLPNKYDTLKSATDNRMLYNTTVVLAICIYSILFVYYLRIVAIATG